MFRSIGKSKIAFALAILFGISLFFFRQGSTISNIFNSDNVIAKVSGTPISTSKYNRTLEMNIQRFNQMLGKQLTGKEIEDYQIHSLSLGALINNAIFENEYDRLGYQLDEKIIAKKTKETIPSLYNDDNSLNQNYLNKFLNEQKLKIEDIVQIIHFETRDKYFDDAFLKLEYPKFFSKKINDYNNHQRLIEYTKIPLELVKIDVNELKINDILKEYYNNNINKFLSEEKREVEYIIVNKENLIDQFTPNKEEIEDYYKNNKILFYKEESRSFIQFNFKTLEEANKFKNEITKIPTFNEIKNYSDRNNIKYNTFNELTKDEVLDEIAETLFTLNIDNISEIVKSTIAYHVIILNDIKPGVQKEFDEVKKDISQEISNIDASNYFDELENDISQDIINGKNLLELSNNYNLNIKTLKNIDRKFTDYNPKNALFFNSLIQNIFNSEIDFISDIVKIDNNNFYLYKVNKVTPSKPIIFEQVKSEVIKDWEVESKLNQLKLMFNENKANSNFLNEITIKFNTNLETLNVARDNSNLPNIFIKSIFDNNLDEVNMIKVENDIYFYSINKILVETNNDLNQQIFVNLRSGLNSILSKNVTISTNDRLIDVILNSFK